MLGGSHMLVGGVSSLACMPLVEAIAGRPLTGTEIAGGAVVTAGAALIPDADTPHSTLSQSLGPITEGLAVILGAVFGGHRNGTHSPVFAAMVTALAAAALARTDVVGPIDVGPVAGLTVSVGAIVAVTIAYVCLAFVLSKALGEHSGRISFIAAVVVALVVIAGQPDPALIVPAVAIGVLSHLFADSLTPEGTVPGWPISSRRFSVPVIGSTGDAREALVVVAFVVGGAYLAWHTIDDRAAAAPHRDRSTSHHVRPERPRDGRR